MKITALLKYGIPRSLLATLFLCFAGFPVIQAQTVTTGTKLVVGSGAIVSSDNPMSVQSGGSLDIQGSLILKNNLVNLNSSASNLGTGVIEMSGTSTQTISGTNTIGKLRVINTAGVLITGDTRVNDSLNIKSGLVTLGSSNLTLGATGLCSAGTVTTMVVATGSGEFRKEFPTSPTFPLNFTYPVGDTTVTAEYTPVTVNFTNGSFGTGNYLGVNLKNQPDPNSNLASGDYLKRYWTLDNNLITGSVSCGLTFNFTNADVMGTKANLFCLNTYPVLQTLNAVSGNQLTATVTSFNRFTGADAALQTSLKAFLQGPYISAKDSMSNTLPTTLPLGDRSDLTKFPYNQPYNGTPWNYTGTESVVTLPANIVDWVLVELRQAATAATATSGTIITKKACFLKQDGSVVDLDGTPLKFYHITLTSNLYPVIRHRNHMAIMAANAVTKDATGAYSYDYSTASSQIYGGAAGIKQVGTRWSMVAGDANADNAIYNNDYTNFYFPSFNSVGQYKSADFNMDSNVYNNDYTNFYFPNFNSVNPLP